ncbi:hypothetical protein Z517_07359 [Fonsecaea pedrosoi CBS 271.37]|uniref:Transcription factor domain-containing protein n=1 Tax=Fonsecaea pedrosoi CBS 271.37 TaxID=1442368 RepID=A0A0D2GIV1_9EURO|nr:uncharacterized protein Z517_07359 [Fonsecaea pedrosoi CBS 271.37]KIW80743.1 hypothetical protein Z517_07359 [Fonsecaea pedrosoi CBS 271.37]
MPFRRQNDTIRGGFDSIEDEALDAAATVSQAENSSQDGESWGALSFNINLQEASSMEELLFPWIAPNIVGDLGELKPVSDITQSFNWVTAQMKTYPRLFARQAETPFIHKSLYPDLKPRSIRAALTVCAASENVVEANKSMLFRILDAEVVDLLQPGSGSTPTLLEDLAKLQAIVLYQIIRLFDGGLSQLTVLEQQADMLKALALGLLQRSDVELRDAQPGWESWILAESVRRTVLLVFLVYGVRSVYQHGVCLELPTLVLLPVSTQAGFWNSKASYVELGDQAGTLKYNDFSTLWLTSPPRELQAFEKLLLVSCKGIDQVQAHGGLDLANQNVQPGMSQSY